MIKQHPNYRFPSEESIALALEACGYEHFMPKQLFRDLINLYAYYYLDGNLDNVKYELPSISEVEFHLQKKEFLLSLPLDHFDGENPLYKAINTLKGLVHTINFRSVESKKVEFEEDDCTNYIEELDEIDQEIFKERPIDMDVIARVLVLSAKFNLKLPVQMTENLEYTESVRMKTYADVHKANKSDLVRPDFKYKFTNRSLVIQEQLSALEDDEEIIVYLEDASSSMLDNDGYSVSKAIQRLLCKDDRKVHYYRYVKGQVEFYKLNTLEEKIEIFSTPKNYYKKSCDYYELFNLVTTKYKKGNIIISADGEEAVPRSINTQLKFFCISRIFNLTMKNFVKRTGGKYIIV